MNNLAQFYKALSDETRLRILSLLSEGELCVCELIEVLHLPQSTISRHLAYLRKAGLIADQRQGNWMYYRLLKRSTLNEQQLWAQIEMVLKQQPESITDLKNLTANKQRIEQLALNSQQIKE